MQQDVIEGFKLSPQQARLWVEKRDSNAYHAQCALLIEGSLEKGILNQALGNIINRHEMLRTTYCQVPGIRLPVQVIKGFAQCDPPVELDFSHYSEAEQRSELKNILLSERQQAFDLEEGLSLKLHLVALSDRKHCLVVDLPSLSADSVTLINFARELAGEYEALLHGHKATSEPLQYAQFAEWQLEMSSGQEPLADESATIIALPFEAREAASFDPRVVEMSFAEDLSATGDSLNSFLFACWVIFLHRMTGLNTIALSYLADGRQFEELEGTFGLIAELVPLKLDVAGDIAFSEMQQRVREAIDEAGARKVAYGSKISAVANQDHQLHIAYEFARRPVGFGFPELSFSIADLYCCSYRFKAKLVCIREPQNVSCELHYDASIFSEETVSGFVSVFQEIVRDALTNARQTVGDINVLGSGERHRLLKALEGPSSDYPRKSCLHHLIEDQVKLNPQSIAVESSEERLTYAELNARANRLAHRLRARGARPEVRVGICIQRSVGMMVALLGVLKSGSAYVPIDPADPEERRVHILSDSQVKVLLTEKKFVDSMPGGVSEIICLDEDSEVPGPGSEANMESGAVAGNLAYVIYTSGSTGKPKGTLITHRGAINYLWWSKEYYDVASGNGSIVFSPITFDMVVTSLFAPLLSGRRVKLVGDEAGIDGLAASLKLDQGLSFVKMTPAHLELLSHEATGEPVADWSRCFILGGEALMAESLSLWRKNAPQTRIVNEYGPTETVVGCCIYEVAAQTPTTGPVAIGNPTNNTQLYVLDQRMRLVPRGVTGELFIAGDGVARGYHNRPGLTADRFLPDPFSSTPGSRMYRTGDLSRARADSSLAYLGRNDEQLKIHGYRIEPGEIETVLGQHASVREALVVAREEEQGQRRLAAYVVLERNTTASVSELRNFAKTQLPDYMVPAYFIKLDAFPLARSGKVDRNALPSPDGIRPEMDELYIPPRTLIEETFSAIWAEVLGIERVGIDDNFFALGGDSIRSIQVRANALRKGLNIESRHLFQHHTIRELARVVAFADAGAIEPVRTEPFSLISDADRKLLTPDIEDAYPLTKLQTGMIFHTEFNPDSAVYHDIHSFHMKARLDSEMLELALNQTIARHPELRTSFDLRRFIVPLQLVHRNVRASVLHEDFTHLSGDELRDAIEQRLEQEKESHFNYECAPLHRFHVIRRSDEEFQFMMIFHHAILDGWSVATLLTELFHRYLSLLHAPAIAPEPPLAITFRDFVQLEKMTLESVEAEQYWNRVLNDTSISLMPRWPASYSPESAAQAQFKMVQIPAEVSAGLKEFARSASVPIKSVLLAAHMKVMGILSGQADVMTGLISNGRPEEADGDRVLGLFLNAVPFRLNLNEGTWLDLVRETFMRERELLPFRRYPLAELQRKNGGQPLFETNFNFMHYHVYQRLKGIEEVDVIDYTGYEETNFTMMAQFSLDLGSSDVRLGLNYHPQALSPAQIDGISNYYVNTLSSMAGEPLRLHHQFRVLSEREQDQLLHDWNPPIIDNTDQRCLADLFMAQAQATPDEVALVFGDRILTYQQLDAMSNRLANYLTSIGVKPEVRVAVYMERSAELMIGLLGILKAGGAYVALDPTYPLERLSFILDEVFAPMILTQEGLVEDLPAYWGQVLCLDAEWDSIAAYTDQRPNVVIGTENLAYILYTSGSTGKPKGVMATQGGLANYVEWAAVHYGAGEGRGALCHSSISFDLTVTSLFTPLLAGKSVMLAAPDNGVDSLAVALRSETDFSLIKITPSHLDLLTELLPAADVAGRVRCLVVGGEALFTEKLDFWRTNAPATRIINEYGPTETVVGCCIYEFNGGEIASDAAPIGRPIENTRLYILDENYQLAPVAVPGELYIAGAGLARGYANRPAATAEKFVPDPFAGSAGRRMYKSGDLARYLPDGNIEYLGRNDQQVKIRGYRIELGEIEAVINAVGGVKQCVVIVKGEAERRALVAYVVREEDRNLTSDEIRGQLRVRLPEYMLPAKFVFLAELPLTDNGKVDKRALLDADSEEQQVNAYEEGQNEVERELASIWQSVLRVEQVGRHDNFFDLGGHSLLAIQVISRVRNALDIDLPLRALFDSPTVVTLAQLIANAKTAGGLSPSSQPERIPARSRIDSAIVLYSQQTEDIETLLSGIESLSEDEVILSNGEDTAESPDINPLSLSQERVWQLEEKDPGTTHYTMRAVLRLTGPLAVSIMERSLNEMFRRHETLRTLFTVRDGKPVQVVGERSRFTLPQIDLGAVEEPDRAAMVQQLSLNEVRRPFIFSEGPLVRVVLIKEEEDKHIVVIVLHQLIADAWALNVFIGEVTLLYTAYIEGRPSPLTELPVQYADFARWERQRFERGELERQLDYWREHLARNFKLTNLPTDRPFPEVPSTHGGGETLVLPRQTVESFRALARQENISLFMSTLAAFKVLLFHLCKQSEVCVLTGVAGRTREETEGIIGSFANALILRTDLSGDPTFRELLKRVSQVSLEAFANQDVPFNLVEQEVRRSSGIVGKRLFETGFDLAVANDNSTTRGMVQNINDLRVEMLIPDEDLVIGLGIRLSLQEIEQDMAATIFYRKDIFDAGTIRQWLRDYNQLLDAVVKNPDARISKFEFLAAAYASPR